MRRFAAGARGLGICPGVAGRLCGLRRPGKFRDHMPRRTAFRLPLHPL